MTQFVSLPSGLVVNLELVNRMVQSDEQGEIVLTVYFSTGDFIALRAQDATALRSRVSPGSGMPHNVKTTIFWIVVLAAITLVWLAIRSASR